MDLNAQRKHRQGDIVYVPFGKVMKGRVQSADARQGVRVELLAYYDFVDGAVQEVADSGGVHLFELESIYTDVASAFAAYLPQLVEDVQSAELAARKADAERARAHGMLQAGQRLAGEKPHAAA